MLESICNMIIKAKLKENTQIVKGVPVERVIFETRKQDLA
jgi:phosphosulfolactate synthase (CoM biosynthesis protein A)